MSEELQVYISSLGAASVPRIPPNLPPLSLRRSFTPPTMPPRRLVEKYLLRRYGFKNMLRVITKIYNNRLRVLVGFESSRRPAGNILPSYHVRTTSWCRVMTEKTRMRTTEKNYYSIVSIFECEVFRQLKNKTINWSTIASTSKGSQAIASTRYVT